MKPVLTRSCQLQVKPEQVAAIEATLKAFAEACDYVNGKVKPKPMNELAIALQYLAIALAIRRNAPI